MAAILTGGGGEGGGGGGGGGAVYSKVVLFIVSYLSFLILFCGSVVLMTRLIDEIGHYIYNHLFTNWPRLSWWLQMSWCLIGTSSSFY